MKVIWIFNMGNAQEVRGKTRALQMFLESVILTHILHCPPLCSPHLDGPQSVAFTSPYPRESSFDYVTSPLAWH